MSEHLTDHTEQNHEALSELESSRTEKLNELSNVTEGERDSADRRAEAAREVLRHHEVARPEPAPQAETKQPAAPKLPVLSFKLNYQQTMHSVQRQLPTASRAFSKVIHTPAVEATSEVLERTVARPSVSVGSTWTALIVGAVFYFTARHFGYVLSGSEMLLSFVVGAVLGLVLEAVWRTLRLGK